MGLIKRLRGGKRGDIQETSSALSAAHDPGRTEDDRVTSMVQRIVSLGLDGAGPLDSASVVAAKAQRATNRTEDAVAKVARSHLIGGSAGGFVTGLGGFVTMPVALPVNVLEFYVLATRMVGAIAVLRGYDVRDERIRTAVLLTLIGSHSDEVLKKAGISTGGGRLAGLATRKLPPAALLVVNKAIGFRLMRGVGEKVLSRMGRGIPVAGGVVGAGVDGWMMKKIADHAMQEFPPVSPTSPVSSKS